MYCAKEPVAFLNNLTIFFILASPANFFPGGLYLDTKFIILSRFLRCQELDLALISIFCFFNVHFNIIFSSTSPYIFMARCWIKKRDVFMPIVGREWTDMFC